MDKKEKVLQLINNGTIKKIVLSEGVAEIKKITNESYFDFVEPLKVKSHSNFKNKIFGCGIEMLDLEKTLKLNNIE